LKRRGQKTTGRLQTSVQIRKQHTESGGKKPIINPPTRITMEGAGTSGRKVLIGRKQYYPRIVNSKKKNMV